mmetsp:Transcript_1593/g.2284  ORF Transcript_1593/g.2284 Transcript_1593/m.2284 type:complete len:81 (+) Transcript_1593:62-304(+)
MRILATLLLISNASAFTLSSFTSGSSLGSHASPSRSSQSQSSSSMLSMKTIAVFGASGLTSSECVYQALKNGDKVVGLTR